jgi:hypothetical protein
MSLGTGMLGGLLLALLWGAVGGAAGGWLGGRRSPDADEPGFSPGSSRVLPR